MRSQSARSKLKVSMDSIATAYGSARCGRGVSSARIMNWRWSLLRSSLRASDVHRRVPLPPTFQSAMLRMEDFQMVRAAIPFNGPLCSVEAPWRGAVDSNIQPLASGLQNLIANGILEPPLSLSKQTAETPPNREKFRNPPTTPFPWPPWRLIATVTKLETRPSHSKHGTSLFLIATKIHFRGFTESV